MNLLSRTFFLLFDGCISFVHLRCLWTASPCFILARSSKKRETIMNMSIYWFTGTILIHSAETILEIKKNDKR